MGKVFFEEEENSRFAPSVRKQDKSNRGNIKKEELMQENIVLKKNSNMVTRVIDDETILMPIYKTSDEINCIYTLNDAASKVWNLINGKRTLTEIKENFA